MLTLVIMLRVAEGETLSCHGHEGRLLAVPVHSVHMYRCGHVPVLLQCCLTQNPDRAHVDYGRACIATTAGRFQISHVALVHVDETTHACCCPGTHELSAS